MRKTSRPLMSGSKWMARTQSVRARLHARWLLCSAMSVGCVFQAGCGGFVIGELEALFAPTSPGNALFVLDSFLFDILGALIF